MRFRSVLFVLFPVLLLWVPAASAQKRVFATVNPNAAALNNSADIYDPLTGVISPVAQVMHVAREKHVALRLANGKVLIAGGYNNHHLSNAEIYDPANGTFSVVGEMLSGRSDAAAVLLPNGTGFITGGYNGDFLRTAELYDPSTATFSLIASQMALPRTNAGIALVPNGDVLVVGGFNGTFLGTAELYNSISRTFTATGQMQEAREGHTTTLLATGKVLVTGGCNSGQSSEIVCNNFLATAEIYDPTTATFTSTGAMSSARKNHKAVLLDNGKVLISGGTNGTAPLDSAEIYDPATGVFTPVGNMGTPRNGHTASALPGGKALIAGGQSDQYLNSAEVFDSATATFTAVSSSTMSQPRSLHSASVLGDGRVLIAGGQNSELLVFDVNAYSPTDNVSPNIVFSPDSQVGYVPYTGSGIVVAFSAATGEVIGRTQKIGKPASITPLMNGQELAVVSVLDNRIFIIDANTLSVLREYSFPGTFGFGSLLTLSPEGDIGYISSTSTGEVIKFDISTGNELGRLKNLSAPAQITVTHDGKTLLIVDTTANKVIIADSLLMTIKNIMDPLAKYPIANFTIYNKAVLNADDTIALIGSQDSAASLSAAFIFDPSTGLIFTDPTADNDEGDDGIYGVGALPGYTTLLPNGNSWLVLTQNALSVVPTINPADDSNNNDAEATSVKNFSMAGGALLGSANIVLSLDERYAFYASATLDQVIQQDLQSGAIVGSFPVGDNPNISIDQASSLAITPEGKTLAVLNFISNELNLLSDTFVYRQTKYISQQDRFTGLSIVNLSDSSTDVTIKAITDGGTEYTVLSDDFANPKTISLAANAQISVDIFELFGFDNNGANTGYLVIESDKPVVVAHSATGQIQGNFLNAYIRNMEGIPFDSGPSSQLYDWIIPEIPRASGSTTELNVVNPNYNGAVLQVTHYGADGTKLETQADRSVGGSQRTTLSMSELVTNTLAAQVLIVGGIDATKTRRSAEIFDTTGFISTSGIPKMPRQGHSAVLLGNGNVLISGGKNGFNILKTAELYSPATKSFTFTPGSMNSERYRFTATLLANDKVLLAGGQNSISISDTAEIYDPAANRFSYTATKMNSPRDAHTATLLSDGRVLIVGGLDGVAASATAEIYDPVSNSFARTNFDMREARAFHTAVLLGDGSVLIAGGYNGSYLDSAEIFNPQTETFTLIADNMTAQRSNHTATVLPDGTVLITGGTNSSGPLRSAELYDPLSGLFSGLNSEMGSSRSSHSATLLIDTSGGNEHRVMIAGGFGHDTIAGATTDDGALGALATSDIYSVKTGLFTRLPNPMSETRQAHTAVLLSAGVQAGHLRATSNFGMLFTEIYSNGGATTAINGINMDKHIGVTSIYSPRFVNSSDRITLLNVINGNQNSSASVTLNVHASDGTVLATKTLTLSRNAQIKGNLLDIFSNDPGLQDQEGWLEVISTADQIVGTVSFTDVTNKYLVTFELSAFPMSHFVFPLISEDSEFMTEISLLNSGNQSATVQLELWGLDGTLDGSSTIILNPQTQMSQTLSEIFPGMQPHRSGNVRIQSSQPIHSMGELSARSLRFASSVQPVAYPEQ